MSELSTPTGAETPEGTQPGDKPKAETMDKLFSQQDLERKISERLERERTKTAKLIESAKAEAIAQWREEQGLDDEALETVQRRDKTATELRSLKGEATKAKNEAETARAKLSKAMQVLDHTLRQKAVIAAAAASGSIDPESVWLHLEKTTRTVEDDAGYNVVVIDDKGEPTSETIEDAVKNLLAKKPNLAAPTGNYAGSGTRITSHKTADDAQQFVTREQRLAFLEKRLGRPE